MSLQERAALGLLRWLDPEKAHDWAVTSFAKGWAPQPGPITSAVLKTDICGLALPNPLGLAAGFDKHGTAIAGLCAAGFGAIEIGGVTPNPQPGNPKPRVFRLPSAHAVINRYGLNSDGAEVVAERLRAARAEGLMTVPVGLNLGANKDSEDRAADYAEVLRLCGAFLDYATVNVSSPNTEGLRDLQGRAALWGVLAGVFETRAILPRRIPILLKIAPDLTEADLEDIAEVAMESALDGIVATNTTVKRDGVSGRIAQEQGGLSGRPLYQQSTEILRRLYKLTKGKLPIIGAGGIEDAETAYHKICAGASALQLYTALTWGGLSLVEKINHGIEKRLLADGFTNIAEAVGCDAR